MCVYVWVCNDKAEVLAEDNVQGAARGETTKPLKKAKKI